MGFPYHFTRLSHTAGIKYVRTAYKSLVENCTGKGPLEELRRTLEYNIKNDLVVNWKIVNCVPLTQGQGPELE
jgi:hypothetical protein